MMYVLLGDFTGHGLTAAVGVLPAAEVFRAMTGKGFSAMEILQAINAKLNRLLPTGMFMTACFVVIEADMKSISVWNAGMPEVLILADSLNQESRVKHRVVSQHLPLGILKNMEADLHPVTLDIARGDRILLCSDGLSEAINARGEEFGMERYEQVATDNPQSFHAVVGALGDFCGNQEFYDDVSLVEIQCQPGLLKTTSA
jgi:serine phosphatase RsbU (regulator of sigma subunit)